MVREPHTVEVPQDHWAYVERGEALVARGVDSCAALALSNPKTGRGYLAHFSTDSGVMEEMIQAALQHAVHPSEVIAWAGGIAPAAERMPGEPPLEAQNQVLSRFRRSVLDAIQRAGFNYNRALWLPPRNLLRVRLVAGETKCSLQTEPAS